MVSVTAVPSTVTLSRPGAQNFASYQVTIRNNTSSNLNHVRFQGMSDVAGGDAALFINPNVSETGVVLDPNPVVVASGTVKCTIEGRSIECTIGHYGSLPQGGVASFNAVVRAPAAGSSIALNWTAAYVVGYSERSISGSTVTALQAASGDSVSVYVPRAGATLFTGVDAVPTNNDRSTTRVTVAPQDSTAIIASLVDDDNGGNSCSPHVQCFGHTVTVLKSLTQTKASVGDGLRSLLLIVLRKDESAIRKGAKIEHAVVLYQLNRAIGGGGTPVRSCWVNGIYTPPGPSEPCIRERREFRKKHGQDDDDHDDRDRREQHTENNAPSSGLSGDWEIVIEGFDNGSFIW